jgi:hypothetical protein
VTNDGGLAITARGVVYALTATNSSPQLGGTGVTNVTGTGTTGVFNVNVSGLAPKASYTFAAYATNGVGTSYSATGTFTTNPAANWLATNGFPADADLKSDPNGDGVNLLLAYALNLDPQQNLSTSMPRPVGAANQMSVTFYAGNMDVIYTVETSTDLSTWHTDGVTLSPLDAISKQRTATFTTPGLVRFMRLVVAVP